MKRRMSDIAERLLRFVRRFVGTSRGLILGGVLIALVAVVATPMRQYLDQRQRLEMLQSQIAANEVEIQRLEAEVDRWQDPAFVKAQVRERLHWVMPKEIGYIVLEADDVPRVEQFVITATNAPDAWYTVLWKSLNNASKPAAPVVAGE